MRALIVAVAVLAAASTTCGEGPMLPGGGRMAEMPPGCHAEGVFSLAQSLSTGAIVEARCWRLVCDDGRVVTYYDRSGRTYVECPLVVP